jgi:hypothetical protein
MYYLFFMARKTFSVKCDIRYVGAVKPFWTQKEYEYQDLILNGFVVHRELPGYSKRDIPFARVDLYFDGPNGLGQKRINGVESKVYKEATKFLTKAEVTEFNRKWTAAKSYGKYDNNDPLSRNDISDSSIPAWHTDKNWMSKNKNEKEYFDTPLQDIILRNDIDPKDLAAEGGLSSLYNYMQGKRELPKSKAEEYAKILGKAPQTLMFDTKMIPCWGNVNLHKQTADINSIKYQPGEIRYNDEVVTVPCPAELYRPDIKAVRVDFDKSVYHGMVAYYYETNISNEAIHSTLNNSLCMVRTYQTLEDEKGNEINQAYYKYYLGIFQIYGNKKRILNLDATSENRVIADNVNVDLVTKIVSLTKPAYLDQDMKVKVENVQKVGRLIREEEELKKQTQILSKKTEQLSQFLLDKYYDNQKEKNKMQKDLDKLIVEMQKVKKQNEEMQRQSIKLFEKQLHQDLDRTLNIYKSHNKPDGVFEFKARKKRA